MKKQVVTLMLMCVTAMGTFAQKTMTVAKDGSGDYTTIQAAIDAAAEGAETVIKVKAGTYAEKVSIGSRRQASTKRITMMGDGMDKTIITAAYGKKNIGNGKDVRDYATLAVFADDFYMENMTVRNTAGKEGGQALALFVSGDRQTYYRCKIAGYQDTHRSKKDTRSYYKECVIEGAVDYIYAGGTCWFEQCTLNSVGNGYITAPEDINVYATAADGTKIWLGFVFNNCKVTKAASVADEKVYLGRCWGAEKCGSLWLNCDLGKAVHPAGWQTMGGNDGSKSFFAEYKSRNGAAPVEVSKRISWSHQMTDADYAKVCTWEQVDAVFRSVRPKVSAFNPEVVIAANQMMEDYAPLEDELLAFPTARGFGKYASGGRGGKVVEVTNLENSGEGSLRWALTEAGKEDATIVFRVSGVINIGADPQRKGENAIRAKLRNVTIAGQTAPGEGILLRGGKLNLGGSENVIIRNIRSRLGVKEDPAKDKKGNFIAGGAIGIENAKNIIIDHCCFGWSGEENTTIYDNHFTTVQWCIIHEGLYNAGHHKGVRGYGCQWGGSPASFHHNLLANNDSRSPRINGASNPKGDRNVFLEFMNNVNFNWGRKNSCYGGENEAGEGSTHECNFVGNYYKPGPAHPSDNYFIELSAARKGKTLTSPSLWYFSGNVMEGQDTQDNWQLIGNKTGFSVEQMRQDRLLSKPDFDKYLTPAESAEKAYQHVLEKTGTIRRDAVEHRVIEDVRSGLPKYKGESAGKQGIIDSPADADGWPHYATAMPVLDDDHDGMADDWETANGLDPTNSQDGKSVVSSKGYTALEVYLNSLMGERIHMDRIK